MPVLFDLFILLFSFVFVYLLVFFGGGGVKLFISKLHHNVPTSCHANESSPSVLNRPFFETGALLAQAKWGETQAVLQSAGPVVSAAH